MSEGARTPWRTVCGGLVETLGALAFPFDCQVCGLEGLQRPFCEDCVQELIEAAGPSCPRCALPLGSERAVADGCSECRNRRLGFDGAWALGPYQGPIRHLCLRMKRLDQSWLAPWVADLWVEAHRAEVSKLDLAGVVPVPSHWTRRWIRGFDQAQLLASRIAAELGRPCVPALARAKPTAKLARFGRTERVRRLRGAFRVVPRRLKPMIGRTALLVDDILTTGATCGAAARTLKAAGVDRVFVAVIGRTEWRG